MSLPVYQYKDKELRARGIPPNTIITPDNYQILLTREGLRDIANRISAATGKKLAPTEIDQLVEFITRLPQSQFYRKPAAEVFGKIAAEFNNRHRLQAALIEQAKPNDIISLTHLDTITTEPAVDDYQRREIAQLTPNESTWKFASFADRRGNALVDLERVEGKRSSPDGILPTRRLTQDEVNKATFEASEMMKNFLAPDYINQLLGRLGGSYLTYNSLALPRQIVFLDTRSAALNSGNAAEYSWIVNVSGKAGSLGNTLISDTLQQIVQVSIEPFWLPVRNLAVNYYGRIRLLIREFFSQSTIVTEFPDDSTPIVTYYHFEFAIESGPQADRVLLRPINSVYTFRKPIAQVNTLTLLFRDPFGTVIFDPDRGIYVITFGTPTLFSLGTDHHLSTGDLIYVTTNSPTSSPIINAELESHGGLIITKTSNADFTVPIDSSSLVGSVSGVHVYYGSKRINLQLEFTALEQ